MVIFLLKSTIKKFHGLNNTSVVFGMPCCLCAWRTNNFFIYNFVGESNTNKGRKILASTPQTDTAKYNKHTTLGLASYFEKQINGTEITDEFRTGFYKNVKITEVSNPNLIATNTNINSIGNQIHVVPSSGCETHHYYFIEFQGQSYMLEIKCPC